MNEDVKQESAHIHSRADELIACLEGEIAKRDARIAELDAVGVANEKLTQRIKELKAELAAIKAQEPVAWTDGAGAMYSASLMASLNISSGGLTALYAAPVSEAKARVYQCPRCATSMQVDVGAKPAKAQGVVMPDVNAAAKALCKRHAMICGVDADDQWKEYSQDFIADAETVLANARLNAAPAAPAADAGLVASEWTKDAEEWGGALNYAAWEFINECPEKSALLFNNTKGPLRAAIMKYAELVSANVKDSSHD